MIPPSKSTLVLETVTLSKLLEPAPQDTVLEWNHQAEPTIRQIKYSIFHEQQVSLLRSNAPRYTRRRWKALLFPPRQITGRV